jgi:flagellar operon protein
MGQPIRPLSECSNGLTPAGVSNARAASASPGEFALQLAQMQDLRFSNHAQKRLQTRQIALTPEDVLRLSRAVDKAAQRGGRESLVLVDDLAFLVNVQERVVITAIDPKHRGEGVFTQVDSVVFADRVERNGIILDTQA